MKIIEYSINVIQELEFYISQIDAENAEIIIDKIFAAKKIFVAGAGRSRLMLSAFAMRLMHLGFQSYVVGETVTPSIEEADLLIIGSGSGETETLVEMAKKAKKIGAQLIVLTIYPNSSVGSLADLVIEIKGRSGKVETNLISVQPGGNLFEQSMLIFLDSTIIRLAEVGKIDTSRFKRHANLE